VLVAGLLVLVVLVAGGALVVVRPGPVKGWLGGGKATVRASRSPGAVTPAAVLKPASGAPEPAAASVGKVLSPLLHSDALGTGVGVSVVDAATGSSLYSSGASTPQTPASVAKLVTATAVLASRGPGYRIATTVVAAPAPGEVVLVGGGDPSLAVNGTGSYPGAARLDQLAAQVKTALGGTRPTKVLVDSTLFGGASTGPGWDSDIVSGGYGSPVTALMVNGGRTAVTPAETTPRSAEPDLAAGQRFAEQLGLPDSAVARGTAGKTAKQLGSVESPPLVDLIEFMLQHSDNALGEAMLRQVALAKGQPGTFAGGTAAERTVLAGLGLPLSGLNMADGSGLSRQDRLSPQFLTALLALVSSGRQANLWPVYTGMPVAAWSGTLAGRYAGPDKAGAGVVRAKTGSLSGTTTLAGLVVDADGRLLAFAMMAEGTGDEGAANEALDKVAVALAGCGCG
jgi:D-alanyl-D-alanine carboxypeptidase/D-alanyl-D-alanine-endopeptidase (penicillin-binding protein 4)